MTAWSYSAIKTFEQCPKKYFHLKVARDIKDEPGEAADYGTAVHEAAEHYVRSGKPIPEKFAYIRPAVERLAALPGDKLAELKMLRSLQMRVNTRTRRFAQVLDDTDQAAQPEVRAVLDRLAERQRAIERAARDIVSGLVE